MTHNTSVRKMEANEGGRGNLAGFEISCSCGFRMGTTLQCDLISIQREHVAVMTRIDAERAVKDKKAKSFARRRATIARNADPFGFKAAALPICLDCGQVNEFGGSVHHYCKGR